MTLTTPALGHIIRLSVSAGGRRLDLSAPSTIPVADLLPGIVAQLRLLSASQAHGGYRLLYPDGTAIDPGRTLGEQHIDDGALLTVESGLERESPRIYDDVVEAVADSVEGGRPWTPADSALTAVGAAIAFLLAGAIVLTGASSSLMIPLACGITAILVATTAIVLSRSERSGRSAHAPANSTDSPAASALAVTATIFGAIAGYTAPAAHPWQLTLAGLGAIVIAVIQLPLLTGTALVTPIVSGSALTITGALLAVTDVPLATIAPILTAVVVTAGNGAPWLAIANTRLRVITPLAESDIYADVELPDPDTVAAAIARGSRFLLALRIAVALTAVAATPVIVGNGWGLALASVTFTSMLLSIRPSFARDQVLVTMIAGVFGLVETLVVAAIQHPGWVGTLSASAAGVAVVIIAATIAPKPRLRWARIADTCELTALALLLPLGLLAAGL